MSEEQPPRTHPTHGVFVIKGMRVDIPGGRGQHGDGAGASRRGVVQQGQVSVITSRQGTRACDAMVRRMDESESGSNA